MVYVVRRKIDDYYLTKYGGWSPDINEKCWLDKGQIINFKECFKKQINSYLIYTILNPCEKINS